MKNLIQINNWKYDIPLETKKEASKYNKNKNKQFFVKITKLIKKTHGFSFNLFRSAAGRIES